MTTNLITDKIVIYFIATIAIIGTLVGTYFLISLIQLQTQHIGIEEASLQDIEAINNLSEIIIDNQHIIIDSQKDITSIHHLINNTLDRMIFSQENNKLLQEVIRILNSSTKITS